ncbi:ABC transporter ATP-binding protein [Actinoallomurus rhizosphaericola]|uniref:ABC transporter ATP-binding protein n=1 Tax=Actinoallomurus rhizosphaericola TaxID=2952536 RepID=UPI002091E6F6|nr:ABC transporter ATP-binding protein [Actinoallomurus rhizosphaericola]MCO5994998.1 ABC transporter ATP-binding protein/permease [Actinoallomurus rhizosphaericola]
MEEESSSISTREAFRRFWPYTRGMRRWLVVGALLLILSAACEVVAIWLFGEITDRVLAAKNLHAFWTPALMWLEVTVLAGVATFGGNYLTTLVGERFLLRLRDTVFAHVQRLSPDFLDDRKLGDLIVRLTGDIEAIEQFVASGVITTVTAAVSAVFFAVAALYVRWDLALVSFTVAPLFWLAMRNFTSRFRDAAVQERESDGALTSVVEESLSNQALVQAYNRQRAEQRRLHREGLSWLEAKMAETRLSALYEPLVQVIETLCVLVVLGFGAWELTNDRITLGGLLSFAAYLGYLYPPIQSLGQVNLTASEATASAERIVEITETLPAVANHPAARTRTARRGRVAFDNVTFCYPGKDRPAIENLSFRAGPEELVLLTGPSGSGKSTITKLLLRFYDPQAGRIRLDGVDIRELSLATLRDTVTLMQQENMLFPGTVRDNIAYGRPDATDEQIVAAARAAEAHDFITALPQGYDTPVGQRGRLLSGGQRQRIAIARAMLRDSPVLILDEPTTGLDAPTARRVLEPLRRLMAGRTTILITHDLHLAPQADKVVVIGETPMPQRPRTVHTRPSRAA